MDAGTLLDGLDPSQHRAVTSPARQLCIEAGAGSGKTRVLTTRIAHRVETEDLDPRRVLVLTFTRRAALELTRRLRRLGLRELVTAGTFHALAYQQLRDQWAARGSRPPSVLDRPETLVANLLPDERRGDAAGVVNEIAWAKARGILPAHYESTATAEGRDPTVGRDLAGAVYLDYERTKEEKRLVDFDDLLRLCCRFLAEDVSFAAAQHWRFRHVFVDEYQDVNPLQFALLEAWLGAEPDLCVVGDPRQAIYGWNGADARFLDEFERYFPDGERVVLGHNHRSSPQIVDVAHAALADDALGVEATRPDGPVPRLFSHADAEDEVRAVVGRVRDHRLPGQPWRAQAVLVRTHRQIPPLRRALEAAGIPCHVRSGDDSPARREIEDGVELVTFHASKGLEWPVVHAVGLEDGFVPIAGAKTSAALDEERRLLHVAMTRAQEILLCSWARRRSFGDRVVSRSPSPWLDRVDEAIRASAEPPAADWRAHLATTRSRLEGAGQAS